MTDRWRYRREDGPGQATVYWHMLMKDQPDVVSLAREAQQRLAPFADGLHMTPHAWLHMTALMVGPAKDLTRDDLQRMSETASELLADVAPITVQVGQILYHPEAIMLAATPIEALQPIRNAAVKAAQPVIAGEAYSQQWAPHVTVCYSTADQAAQPLIDALGMGLTQRDIRVSALSLVIQHGPERDWNWTVASTIELTSPALA